MLHALTMSVVGLRVVFGHPWSVRDLISGRDELVAAFLGLELAFLMQARGWGNCSCMRSFGTHKKPSSQEAPLLHA